MFFDCFNGDANAIDTDKEIFISLWNARTGAFLRDFTVNRSSSTTVENSDLYNCVINPGSVCVQSFVFNSLQTIDLGTDGVIIAWQRCCRNNKIDNIINPGESGFTAWTVIPPSNIVNSSPQFTEIPPIFTCVDAPFEFSQKAQDADGDSLVYSLTTPFLGGAVSPDDRIRPSNRADYDRPPFRNVIWSGGYNEQYQMPSAPALNIDSETGIMTATPNRTGDYTIGVSVKEYRNGVLIGESRRDYQISVINCQFNVLADFDLPSGTAIGGSYVFECGDTVVLRNKSRVRSDISAKYFWDFGDPTTTTDTLTTFDLATPVSYIYPGNGNYTVTLTIKTPICEDDYNYNIRIRSSKTFELGADRRFCDEFSTILDTKTPDAIDITWNTGEKDSRIIVRDSGLYYVEVSYGNCSYSDSITIRQEVQPPPNLPDDLFFCKEVNAELDAGVEARSYLWTTPARDITREVTITDTGLFSVTVFGEFCNKSDTIRIWQSDTPDVADQFFCGDFSVELDAGDIEEATYRWSTGDVGPVATFTEGGTFWVESIQRGCVNRDSFSITNPTITFNLGVDTHFCDRIDILLDGGSDGVTYEWSTGENTRTISPNVAGTYSLRVVDIYGCEKEDSIRLSLSTSPTLDLGADTTICVNEPTDLIGPPDFDYLWSNGSTDQTITVTRGENYSLTITDDQGCSGSDTLLVTVDPSALPNLLYFPNAFTPNGDNLNEGFPHSTSIRQPGFEIKIYTRWGEIIFDSINEETNSWDGTYKGEKAPPGIYMYTAYYRGCDGNKRNQSGTFYAIW